MLFWVALGFFGEDHQTAVDGGEAVAREVNASLHIESTAVDGARVAVFVLLFRIKSAETDHAELGVLALNIFPRLAIRLPLYTTRAA